MPMRRTPGQPVRRAVGLRVQVGHHPGHDRAHRAPRDTEQLRDRALGHVAHQPCHLVVETAGMPRPVPRPRHRRDHHPVHKAPHPRRRGLHKGHHQAHIHRAPPPPTRAEVITRTSTPTHSTPRTLTLHRPHRDDQRVVDLVELDTLHHGLLHTHDLGP